MSLHRSVREGIAAATLIRSTTGTQDHRQQQPAAAAAASVHGGVPVAAAAQVAQDADEDATGQEEEEEEEYNELLIRGRRWEQPLNLHSIQHLVNFLRQQEKSEHTSRNRGINTGNNNNNNNDTAVLIATMPQPLPRRQLLRHLKLHAITIQNRHGELNILRDFFMETKLLKKVTIMACTLGRTANDVEQLLSAFYPSNNNNNNTNNSSSIVHLDFWRLSHLQGEALGQCLANILHNNYTLQRLECWGCPTLSSTGVAVMQSALQSNRNLLELNLSSCNIGNEGLTCLATAIADNPNSVLQVLNISGTNQITIDGIETGIIKLATCERLRKIDFGHDVLVHVLRHAQHSWQLARVLCSSNLYLQKLVGVSHAHFPDCRSVVSSILGILARNKLLAPQPDTHELLDSNSGIWSMALTKFAQQSRHDDNVIHSPTTCIFQILQRRPFLVPYIQQQQQQQQRQEGSPPRPLQVPPVATIPSPPPRATRQEENHHPNDNDDEKRIDNDGPNKRARLE